MAGFFAASLDPSAPDAQTPESYDAILRKRKLAEALLGKGAFDTSPVQSWTQGLARMAQAWVAGDMQREADAKEKASNAKYDGLMNALLGGGAAPAPGGTAPSLGPIASDGGPAPVPPKDIPAPGPGPLTDAIKAASDKFGIDPAYLTRTAQIESNYGQNLQSPLSSAGGPFAFTDATARQYGLANKNDPLASAEAAARLALDNKTALAAALKRDPTPAELYLAHQQGAGGASALLANPNASAVDALTPVYGSRAAALKAIQNNGGRPDMTAGDFAAKWITKFGGAPNAVAAIAQAAPTQVASNAPGLGYAPSSGGASLSGNVPPQVDELTVKALQDYARRKNLQPPAPEMGPAVPLQNTPLLPGAAPILPPGLSAANGPAGGAGLVNPDAISPGAMTAGPGPSPLRDTGDGSYMNPFLEGSPEAKAAGANLPAAGAVPAGPAGFSVSPASGMDRAKMALAIALNPSFSPQQRQMAMSVATMLQKDSPTWGKIGTDAMGREIMGWINPRTQQVTPGPQIGGADAGGMVTVQGPNGPVQVPAAAAKQVQETLSKKIGENLTGPKTEEVTSLRKEVQNLPSYKNIAQAAPIYQAMKQAAGVNSKAADLDLVYGLGKIMDPNSVVREGEMVMVKNSAGLPDFLIGAINSLNGGQALTPETRAAIMKQAHNRVTSYQSQFDLDAKQYRGIAQRNRMNIEDVLPNFGTFDAWTPPPAAGQSAIDAAKGTPAAAGQITPQQALEELERRRRQRGQ